MAFVTMTSSTAAEIKQDLVRAGLRKNKPLSILLVDDSTVVHKMLAHRFKMLNWKMTGLYNGQEAITFYEETGFKNIDMILMDKDMPVMTGDVATTKLIQMGCDTPIVALSSSAESLDEFVIRGAMGALSKPLQIPNLLQTLLRTRSMKVEAERQKQASSRAQREQPREVLGEETQTVQPQPGQTREILWAVAEQRDNVPTMVKVNPNVESWTGDEVCRWLQCLGHAYTMYTTAFRYHGISGKMLLAMHSPDHFDMLGVNADLHRKRLQHGVLELRSHMTKYREDTTKKQLLSTASEQKTDSVDEDIVEDLFNRYAGDGLSEIMVNLVERSLSRLSTESKEKIKSLLNNGEGKSNQT